MIAPSLIGFFPIFIQKHLDYQLDGLNLPFQIHQVH